MTKGQICFPRLRLFDLLGRVKILWPIFTFRYNCHGSILRPLFQFYFSLFQKNKEITIIITTSHKYSYLVEKDPKFTN